MRTSRGALAAELRSAVRPTEEQLRRFEKFLADKYKRKVPLRWEEDPALKQGFRLQVGADMYDWTMQGRVRQFRDYVRGLESGASNILPLMRQAVEDWAVSVSAEEIGEVVTVDGEIATVKGLDHVQYGEILLFSSGVKGMVQDLRRDGVSCILFGSGEEVSAGGMVRRTLKTAGMPVGEGFLGRVVDALGVPVDGRGRIMAEGYRPIEAPAPGILDRQPVNTPMETGLLAIDSMFPIGRGQRELIIGDRQTGKTAIALDAILNQKGKDMVCIYVAIGQKTGSVAQIVENLSRRGAMEYTAVVSAPASASAALQYIAPYAGCALGEYFMRQGRDVLIVYDDLSKHAIAYRTLSLLLERAAHLSDELGGGSMTALPIVETQAGDVSAYIPTNIISITDGQIFLESDLFFAGQRPAVNVGLSVSRVGGDAQTKAMKKAVGTLRLDLAQYREMEVFTQFSSDLDDATKRQLTYGQGLMRLLRQPRYAPLSQHQQVIVLAAAMAHVMQDVPLERMDAFRAHLLSEVEAEAPDLCGRIDRTGRLDPEDREEIVSLAKHALESFSGKKGG